MSSINSFSEKQKQEKELELEMELELEKQRLTLATQTATDKFQQALSVENWIKDYPLPTAALMALGGFVAAQLFYDEVPAKKSTLRPLKPESTSFSDGPSSSLAAPETVFPINQEA